MYEELAVALEKRIKRYHTDFSLPLMAEFWEEVLTRSLEDGIMVDLIKLVRIFLKSQSEEFPVRVVLLLKDLLHSTDLELLGMRL
mgnify:CR=1 FL=1